jgi:hypothetical protein
MPYPNPYGGLSAGVTSAGSSIAAALRKLEEQKQQEEWLNKLKSYIAGQDPNTPGPTLTDWGSNVTTPGQPAGTLPPPQTYDQSQYGAPVDWSSMSQQPESGGSNKGGMPGASNKGGS